MNGLRRHFESVDEYVASFPENAQAILQKLRRVVKESAPGAEEVISYQIPGFKLNGNLVWFAAFKDHIGFYPRESAIEAFKEKLKDYDVSKGTARFPMDQPIPYELIREIVKFRVKENLRKK